jgi:glucosyl-3-phosphoglycerate phosphatase
VVDLILLRHGRTDWNVVRRIQGQSDSQLDDLGHAQAEAVAPAIAALGPTVLWSSDSDRTRDTASYVARVCGLVPTYDPRLREYSFGAREGLYHHEFQMADADQYRSFLALDWDKVAGAEKYHQVAGRMAAALTELVALVPDDGVALAVSHGASIRTALATLLGWPEQQALSLRGMDNCGYAIIRRPAPDAPWRLHAYNRTVPVPPDFIEPGAVG